MAYTGAPAGSSSRRSISVALFSLTLFVSAALLFLLEPMFAKMALPVLGGTTAVWTTCLVFYQALLLAGYAFANFVTRRLTYRQQALLFLTLTGAALTVLPVGFPADRVPPPGRNPISWLLMILVMVVGLPFFVMSTMAPTLQKWFAHVDHEQSSDPYFLYAASNAGSLLGLLSYPILVEPHFRLAAQSRLWEYGYILLIALLMGCAIGLWRASVRHGESADRVLSQEDALSSSPALWERLFWITFAFVPSSLLLGVTTVITTEIPPVPMLWVLPLAVYLLSFIVVFTRKPLVSHLTMAENIPLVILAAMIPLLLKASWPFFVEVSINLMMLFVVAVACHGELAKRRPSAEHLTGFYLLIALGSVLGGLFNAVIAPRIFSTVVEYPLALACAALLQQVISPRTKKQPAFVWLDLVFAGGVGSLLIILLRVPPHFGISSGTAFHLLVFGPAVLLCYRFSRRPIRFALGFAALWIAATAYTGAYQRILSTQRSFYGINRIALDDSGRYRILFSGQTIHGIQSLSPGHEREPLSYFSHSSPIGQVFEAFADSQESKTVGVAGLGAGTLACYTKPGAEFTFYEIDPVVVRIASDRRYFTFLSDCAPQAQIVVGDARISLHRAPDRHYGLFIVDVFGGDAIPLHMLTREAIQLYLSKLDAHGVIALHITNRYLRLQNVAGNLAKDAGLMALWQDDRISVGSGKAPSTWVVMARTKEDLGALTSDPRWLRLGDDPRQAVWADDYSSVLDVFAWD